MMQVSEEGSNKRTLGKVGMGTVALRDDLLYH